MKHPEPTITVNVDVTNPGQFFACCGLLELADRLWPGAEGWFAGNTWNLTANGSIHELIETITSVDLEPIDPNDDTSSPLRVPAPFSLTLDWWKDESGRELKVWAGRMSSLRIARAMLKAMERIAQLEQLFDHAAVVYDPEQPRKKVEPFYFDSRRGKNAQSLDIGFATDSLKMTTVAHPAVEFLCLVGLQRFRPARTETRRLFQYHVWNCALPVVPAAAAASGRLPIRSRCFQFENAFRTDQKKHKSFLPATLTGERS